MTSDYSALHLESRVLMQVLDIFASEIEKLTQELEHNKTSIRSVVASGEDKITAMLLSSAEEKLGKIKQQIDFMKRMSVGSMQRKEIQSVFLDLRNILKDMAQIEKELMGMGV